MPVAEQIERNTKLLQANLSAIHRLNEKDADVWTPEDQASFDRMMEECESLESSNDRLRKAEDLNNRLAAPIAPEDAPQGMTVGEQRENDSNPAKDDPVDAAIRRYLLTGQGGNGVDGGFSFRMGAESHKAMIAMTGSDLRKRALSVGANALGGSTVGQMMITRWEEAMYEHNPVRAYAEVIPTEDGQNWPWPTVNDSSNEGERLAEGADGTDQDMATGAITLYAHRYGSKVVRVSRELLQDSDIPLDAVIGRQLAERIAKIQNTEFTNTAAGGGATTKPAGVVDEAYTAAGALTAANTAAITYDKMLDIESALLESWLMNAAWYCNRSMRAVLMKIKDGDSRPIFNRDPQGSPYGDVLGYPIRLLNKMEYAATKKVLLFGDMRQYKVREAMTIELSRLLELYARNFQVGFVAHSRADGRLMYAGDAAEKPLVALTLTALT